MKKIKHLLSLFQVNNIYDYYLYERGDMRALNLLLKRNGFKPIGELRVQLKDDLYDEAYPSWPHKEHEGQVYTIIGFSIDSFDTESDIDAQDVIFWTDEVGGDFDFTQVERIV